MVGPRLKIVESILDAADDDGDIDATVTPLTARVGLALIDYHFLLTGEPPNRPGRPASFRLLDARSVVRVDCTRVNRWCQINRGV